jgi:hypothetical protein
VLTLAAVAAHKGITPEKIEVRIVRESAPAARWQSAFAVEIDLGQGLTPRERTILYNSARGCEVHHILAGDVAFDYRLVQGLGDRD